MRRGSLLPLLPVLLLAGCSSNLNAYLDCSQNELGEIRISASSESGATLRLLGEEHVVPGDSWDAVVLTRDATTLPVGLQTIEMTAEKGWRRRKNARCELDRKPVAPVLEHAESPAIRLVPPEGNPLRFRPADDGKTRLELRAPRGATIAIAGEEIVGQGSTAVTHTVDVRAFVPTAPLDAQLEIPVRVKTAEGGEGAGSLWVEEAWLRAEIGRRFETLPVALEGDSAASPRPRGGVILENGHLVRPFGGASRADEVDLVVRLVRQNRRVEETCDYTDGSRLTTFLEDGKAEIFDRRTGARRGGRVFPARSHGCPGVVGGYHGYVPGGARDIVGGPDYEQVAAWAAGFAK